MKNIAVCWIKIGETLNVVTKNKVVSNCHHKIFKNKMKFEIFIDRVKFVKKIDEIIFIAYEHSDAPFQSELSQMQINLCKNYCSENSIDFLTFDYAKFDKLKEKNLSEYEIFVKNLFKKYIGCNLIYFYDDSMFFDIDTIEELINFHIEENSVFTTSDALEYIGITSIIKWNDSLKFSENEKVYRKKEKIDIKNFYNLLFSDTDTKILVKIFEYYKKTLISFNEYYEYYLNSVQDFIEFPKHLVIELTNKCNHNCKICPYPKLKRPKNDMKLSLFKKIIDDIKLSLSKHITLEFSGFGEPLLHSQFYEMIGYANNNLKNLCEIDLYTNASLLDLDCYIKLKELGVTNIFVSLDAVSSETYNIIHNSNEYEKIVKNIVSIAQHKKKYKSYLPRLIPNFILCQDNKNEVIEFLKLYGIRNIISKTEKNSNQIDLIKRLYSDKHLPYDYTVIRGNNNYAGQIEKNIRLADYSPFERKFCNQLKSGILILSDGSVTFCRQDYEGKYKFGSLLNSSLMDILKYSNDYINMLKLQENKKFDKHELCLKCSEWFQEYN